MALAEEGNGLLYVEDQIPRVAILHGLAVEPSLDPEIVGVLQHFRADDAGSVRRPAVESLPERPLAASALNLPFSVGDVVADGVAQHVVQRIGLGHIDRLLSNDDHELAFVVEPSSLLSQGVYGDRVGRTRERGRRLILVLARGRLVQVPSVGAQRVRPRKGQQGKGGEYLRTQRDSLGWAIQTALRLAFSIPDAGGHGSWRKRTSFACSA